jgi:hypothetical protein
MGSQNLANLTLGGGDPREGEKNPALFALDNGHEAPIDTAVGFSIDAALVHNDPNVLFEEYLHYAAITRAEEREYEKTIEKQPFTFKGVIKSRFSTGHKQTFDEDNSPDGRPAVYSNAADVTDLDWRRASRATRTATWTSIFFLITTDILGPSGAP